MSPDRLYHTEFWKLLDDLEALSNKLDFSYLEIGRWSAITFSIIDGNDESIAKNLADRRFYSKWEFSQKTRARYILRISSTVRFSRSEVREMFKGWRASEKNKTRQYRDLLAGSYKDLIHDLLLIVNIARPSLFEVRHGYLFQDGRLAKTTGTLVSLLVLAREQAEEISWPQLESLDLLQVWNWAIENKLLGTVGITSLGRAFNAFSYFFNEPISDEAPLLFWALVGIEALYVSTSVKVMEQVRERTQLVLGPITEYKKKLSQMYAIRSSFIHGALPFPGRFFTHDAMPDYEQYMTKVTGATVLAQAILTASLQKMVINGWSQLRFVTILDAI